MIYIRGRELLAISRCIISSGRSTAWGGKTERLCMGRSGDSPPHATRLRPICFPFRNQNVTESETSDAGMAIVPLVLLVPLVLMIPPQLPMAVVLS